MAQFVNVWLAHGEVLPAAYWPHRHAPMVLLQGNLDMTQRLAFDLAVAFQTAVYQCKSCEALFTQPDGRRPGGDRARYCPECRDKGVPGLVAKKKWWQRNRGKAAKDDSTAITDHVHPRRPPSMTV
jgi:hypothetical protein